MHKYLVYSIFRKDGYIGPVHNTITLSNCPSTKDAIKKVAEINNLEYEEGKTPEWLASITEITWED